MAELFVPYPCKYSILEPTKQIVWRNDSSVYLCRKVKMPNYHPGQLSYLRLVSSACTLYQCDGGYVLLQVMTEWNNRGIIIMVIVIKLCNYSNCNWMTFLTTCLLFHTKMWRDLRYDLHCHNGPCSTGSSKHSRITAIWDPLWKNRPFVKISKFTGQRYKVASVNFFSSLIFSDYETNPFSVYRPSLVVCQCFTAAILLMGENMGSSASSLRERRYSHLWSIIRYLHGNSQAACLVGSTFV